jgi:hypothetical protein
MVYIYIFILRMMCHRDIRVNSHFGSRKFRCSNSVANEDHRVKQTHASSNICHATSEDCLIPRNKQGQKLWCQSSAVALKVCDSSLVSWCKYVHLTLSKVQDFISYVSVIPFTRLVTTFTDTSDFWHSSLTWNASLIVQLRLPLS